jgi:hypothetical protein
MKIKSNDIFNLLTAEMLASKKYYITFFIVLTVFFSVTIAMFSTAVAVPKQYGEDLHKAFPDGISILINDLKKFDAIKNCGADYIRLYGMDAISLKYGDKTADSLRGEAHVFKNELDRTGYLSKLEKPFLSGRAWTESDNTAGRNVWLSESAASALDVSAGRSVTTLVSGYSFDLVVAGVYAKSPYEGDLVMDFIISADLAAYFFEKAEVGFAGMGILIMYDVLDITKATDNLDKENIGYFDIADIADAVRAYGLSKVLFWIITAVLFFIGAFAIINLASMIINTREKTYGLYKILGATTADLMKICFISLLSVLFVSIIAGIFGSLAVNSYFQDVASDLFLIAFKIEFIWYAPLCVLGVNLFLFFLYYTEFRKRYAGISPLLILLEEK